VCSSVAAVAGHAYLAEPPSRDVVANREQREYCPHCLQAGGPNTVSERGGGQWPTREAPASHGLCGDPVQNAPVAANWRDETYLVPTPVQRTYTPGEIVEFQVGVSTHHRGHYEFRICDMALDGQTLESRDAGQACLNRWTLQRAPLKASCSEGYDPDPDCQPIDENHPERWYLPPGGEGWSSGSSEALAGTAEVHRMRYTIPADLTCSRCTLQWYYSTGNTCLYDGDYFTHFAQMQAQGWPSMEWCNFCTPGASCSGTCCGPESGKFGEEFWNCADIAVQAGGGPQPPVAPTPASSLMPEPVTQAPAPSPATQAPTPSGGCSAVWVQCGGNGWTGAACCEAGSHCSRQSEWYSQCKPGNEAPPATTPQPTPVTQAPTEAPATGAPPPVGGCASLCVRQNWTQSGGCGSSTDEASCSEGYIVKGEIAVPCAWTGCGCFADGEQLQECPALDTLCTSLLQQHRGLRGHRRAARRHSSSGGAAGMMFIEEAQTLSRVEDVHTEL